MPFKTSLSTIEDDGVGGVAEDGWMGGGGSESGETESIASLSKMREELVAGRSSHPSPPAQAPASGRDSESATPLLITHPPLPASGPASECTKWSI